MIKALNELIEALRQELQEYGEMLARLESQQDFIVRRAADDLSQSLTGINEQGAIIQHARESREELQAKLAECLGEPDATLAEIIDMIPADYRPLLRALINENNELLTRVQQRARQNHLLLRRSLDLMRDFLQTLFPTNSCGAYDGTGNRLPTTLPACALVNAAG